MLETCSLDFITQAHFAQTLSMLETCSLAFINLYTFVCSILLFLFAILSSSNCLLYSLYAGAWFSPMAAVALSSAHAIKFNCPSCPASLVLSASSLSLRRSNLRSAPAASSPSMCVGVPSLTLLIISMLEPNARSASCVLALLPRVGDA